jgi:hypothetical protein
VGQCEPDPTPYPGYSNGIIGGPNNPASSASQEIDVAAQATAIDTGLVAFDLAAWLGGFSSQSDWATITVTFQDAQAVALGSAAIGPVTNLDRNNVSRLLHRSTSGFVPAGTRLIRLLLECTRFDGQYNDGSADGVRLSLSSPFEGQWVDLGGGIPGTGGDPVLEGQGLLESGQAVAIGLIDAPAFEPAFLVMGFSVLQAPFKGGVLVPVPDIVVGGVPTNADGAIWLDTVVPPGLPSGSVLAAQYWFSSGVGPAGFIASNGVAATSP